MITISTGTAIILTGLIIERMIAYAIVIGKAAVEAKKAKPAKNAEKAAKKEARKNEKLAKKTGLSIAEVEAIRAELKLVEQAEREEKAQAKLMKKFK